MKLRLLAMILVRCPYRIRDGTLKTVSYTHLDVYKRQALYVSRLENPPPNRCCYKIKHRSPLITTEKALDHFCLLYTSGGRCGDVSVLLP